ncbi:MULTISPECIES: hypothetical protein [Muribaculum]|uniref:hypothetical protein n=1 Tax=Muribaculum TaxID=1918540 RepID=UPI001455C75A|nr:MULTISPECIES: hypothetical protein [Muribaculum]
MITIICTIALLLIAIILLGVKVLFIRGSKFPSGHIHNNAALRSRNINCVSAHDNKNK